MTHGDRVVSNRIIITFLEGCCKAGIPVEPLLVGLSFSEADLSDHGGWQSWDDWTTFLDRLQENVGGPQQLADFGVGLVAAAPFMQIIAAFFVSPRQMYLHGGERVARRSYRIPICYEVRELSDGRIRVAYRIPETRRGSEAMGHFTAGIMRAYPCLVGQPEAHVEAHVELHSAEFLITPPPSRTLLARAEELLRRTLDRLVPRFTSTDLQDAVALGFDDFVSRSSSPLVQHLARHTDLAALVRDLDEVVRRHLPTVNVALLVGDELVLAPGAKRPISASQFPLRVGDQEVGRLEVEHGLGDSEVLKAILPWLAVGVQSCSLAHSASLHAKPTEGDVGVRLSEAVTAWRLTPRQTQALELLVAGCCNKEIAAALGCSLKTVEAHVSQILRRAEVDSRAALLASFWRERFADAQTPKHNTVPSDLE